MWGKSIPSSMLRASGGAIRLPPGNELERKLLGWQSVGLGAWVELHAAVCEVFAVRFVGAPFDGRGRRKAARTPRPLKGLSSTLDRIDLSWAPLYGVSGDRRSWSDELSLRMLATWCRVPQIALLKMRGIFPSRQGATTQCGRPHIRRSNAAGEEKGPQISEVICGTRHQG